MGNKAEIKYEFKNAKSFKIHPKENRQPVSRMALSSPSRIERRALVASEREVKHLMTVANRMFGRINKMIQEKDHSLEMMIKESVINGSHLANEVFIPEYLGFMEVPPGPNEVIRIYAKEGHSMTRMDDGWLVSSTPKGGGKTILKLPNMQVAIIVFESLGFDINFKDYFKGKFDENRKTLEECVSNIKNRILDERESGQQKKIG